MGSNDFSLSNNNISAASSTKLGKAVVFTSISNINKIKTGKSQEKHLVPSSNEVLRKSLVSNNTNTNSYTNTIKRKKMPSPKIKRIILGVDLKNRGSVGVEADIINNREAKEVRDVRMKKNNSDKDSVNSNINHTLTHLHHPISGNIIAGHGLVSTPYPNPGVNVNNKQRNKKIIQNNLNKLTHFPEYLSGTDNINKCNTNSHINTNINTVNSTNAIVAPVSNSHTPKANHEKITFNLNPATFKANIKNKAINAVSGHTNSNSNIVKQHIEHKATSLSNTNLPNLNLNKDSVCNTNREKKRENIKSPSPEAKIGLLFNLLNSNLKEFTDLMKENNLQYEQLEIEGLELRKTSLEINNLKCEEDIGDTMLKSNTKMKINLEDIQHDSIIGKHNKLMDDYASNLNLMSINTVQCIKESKMIQDYELDDSQEKINRLIQKKYS